MGVARTIKVFAAGAWLKATGSRSAGHALVDALDSDDEDASTLAGMFLVKSGSRAEPALEKALRERRHVPTVLTILGDIGDAEAQRELERFRDDPDPEVARAARDALETLQYPREPKG